MLKTWHYLHSPAATAAVASAIQQSTDISSGWAHSSKPAAAALQQSAHAGSDRQTGGGWLAFDGAHNTNWGISHI